jgi:lipid-A-disaccharide synthase
VMFGAASRLLARDPTLHMLLPLAEARYQAAVEKYLLGGGLMGRVRIVAGDSHAVMRASDLILAASGTATLEAALLGVPTVILYRTSRLTYAVVRACIRLGLIESDTVGLPNLILGRRAVPELIQFRATGERIAREAWSILADARRAETIRRDLREAAARVSGRGSLEQVARVVIEQARAKTSLEPVSVGSSAVSLRDSSSRIPERDERATEAT